MSISFSHDHVGLSVTAEDLDATIEWYTSKLGFTADQRFDSHGTTFVFIVSGDVKIELMAGASSRQAPTDNVLTSMDPARYSPGPPGTGATHQRTRTPPGVPGLATWPPGPARPAGRSGVTP